MPKFIDEIRIKAKAGDGGDGIVSFRHEAGVPKGGPDGGNGGDGGSVFFVGDHNLNTLSHFASHKNLKAENGEVGGTKKMSGKAGADLIIKVPLGTIVFDGEDKLVEILEHEQKALIAQGGEGGFGNAHFRGSRHQSPQFAELGLPGEERDDLRLELQTIADVGLVGLPNVGKSTLLSVISKARPKIANYEFTTLSPNIGVVDYKKQSFVMADIPGLIEGASSGKGLGHDFLRHVSRTRLLVHILDGSREDLKKDYKKIRDELKLFDPALAKKKEILVINKIDQLNSETREPSLPKKKEIFKISALNKEGVDKLLDKIIETLSKMPKPKKVKSLKVFTPEKYVRERFEVEKAESGYRVIGGRVERLVLQTDFENEEAMQRMRKAFKAMAVQAELVKAGAKNGDTIFVAKRKFEFEKI